MHQLFLYNLVKILHKQLKKSHNSLYGTPVHLTKVLNGGSDTRGEALPVTWNYCYSIFTSSNIDLDKIHKAATWQCRQVFVTGPVKIGHVDYQNLTTFQTFVTHNFLLQYGMATKFSEIVHNLTGFPTHLTETKYYISVLRYVSPNHMVYFSPHALFSQAQSHLILTHMQHVNSAWPL